MTLKAITRGALAVTLVYLSFFLFKGPMNILNALFVPLIIYFFTLNNTLKEVISVYVLIILFCLLFFNFQLFFLLFYCLIGGAISYLHKKNTGKLVSFISLTLVTSISFWLGILFTDFAFHTQINKITLSMLNNNYLTYMIIILIEAGIVSSLSLFSIKFFTQRIVTINK